MSKKKEEEKKIKQKLLPNNTLKILSNQQKQDLLDLYELIKSGYSGIDMNGDIVDRRYSKDALPIEQNKLLGNPKPKAIYTGIYTIVNLVENAISISKKNTVVDISFVLVSENTYFKICKVQKSSVQSPITLQGVPVMRSQDVNDSSVFVIFANGIKKFSKSKM